MAKQKSINDIIEDVSCLCRKVANLTRLTRITTVATDDYAIGQSEGVVVFIGSAVDPKLPNPATNKYRRITVVNYTTDPLIVASHDGSTVIRGTSGAATNSVTVAVGAAASTTGSRLTFHSDGTSWFVVNN